MKFNNPNGNTCTCITIVYVNICDCLFQFQMWKKMEKKIIHMDINFICTIMKD